MVRFQKILSHNILVIVFPRLVFFYCLCCCFLSSCLFGCFLLLWLVAVTHLAKHSLFLENHCWYYWVQPACSESSKTDDYVYRFVSLQLSKSSVARLELLQLESIEKINVFSFSINESQRSIKTRFRWMDVDDDHIINAVTMNQLEKIDVHESALGRQNLFDRLISFL